MILGAPQDMGRWRLGLWGKILEYQESVPFGWLGCGMSKQLVTVCPAATFQGARSCDGRGYVR